MPHRHPGDGCSIDKAGLLASGEVFCVPSMSLFPRCDPYLVKCGSQGCLMFGLPAGWQINPPLLETNSSTVQFVKRGSMVGQARNRAFLQVF